MLTWGILPSVVILESGHGLGLVMDSGAFGAFSLDSDYNYSTSKLQIHFLFLAHMITLCWTRAHYLYTVEARVTLTENQASFTPMWSIFTLSESFRIWLDPLLVLILTWTQPTAWTQIQMSWLRLQHWCSPFFFIFFPKVQSYTFSQVYVYFPPLLVLQVKLLLVLCL